VPLPAFALTLADFVRNGGCGANVTLPFKEEAFALMAACSERAQLARSVNTIVVKGVDDYFGDNTDGIGLLRDFARQKVLVAGARVLVLGAGGAARGILPILLQQSPEEVLIANRTLSKAEQIVTDYAILKKMRAGDLTQLLHEGTFAIVINATSMGLTSAFPTLPTQIINRDTFCYDLMYAAQQFTPFLQWAVNQNPGRFSDGLGMLVEQAAESFFLWRGVRPDTAPVLAALNAKLGR
jgi:shikimate dehydrogenase